MSSQLQSRMMTTVVAAILWAAVATTGYADGAPDATTGTPDGHPPGASWALEASAGTQGILSFEEVGVRLPLIGGSCFIGLSARLLSSLTWATFTNLRTGATVSFHPDVVGGVVSFGGVSPMFHDTFRMYGQSDLFLGYSFMPWDSAIYGVGNLIGDNLTYAVWGCYGVEVFTAPSVALFVSFGGGFKSMAGEKSNPYVIASSWLGSGFGIRSGLRFYL
jgi:hypothetical protein